MYNAYILHIIHTIYAIINIIAYLFYKNVLADVNSQYWTNYNIDAYSGLLT